MPKYAHKYIRQRELGKKVTRPLKTAREYVRKLDLKKFNYQEYIEALYDKGYRTNQRYQLHRRAMPTDFRALNIMRSTINKIDQELLDLGEFNK